MEGKIKIGPVGNHDLNTTTMVNCDEGSHNGIISQIFLSHSFEGIFSIQFQFMLHDEKFILSDHHGRNIGSKFDAIAFNYPHEYITGISGEFCKTTPCLTFPVPPHIRRLKFTTNTNEYGPFGSFKGLYAKSSTSEENFEFKLGKFCQFGGFYGTYDVSGLQCIGIYLLPTIVKPKGKPKTVTSNAEERESTIVLG